MTTNEKVAALPEKKKERIRTLIDSGKTATGISKKLRIEYSVVRIDAWQEGILPWQGHKSYISRRSRRIGGATGRSDREQIATEIREQADYLYYSAKRPSDQMAKVKKSVRYG